MSTTLALGKFYIGLGEFFKKWDDSFLITSAGSVSFPGLSNLLSSGKQC